MNKSIAIIGGGFSGCMVASHLLRQTRHPLQIRIIEPRSILGKGAAYSTAFDGHLLNVVAAKMSAFPDSPAHFIEWLRTRGRKTRDDEFVPRKLFGEYVTSILDESRRLTVPGVTFEFVNDEVVDLDSENGTWRIRLARGDEVASRTVVLATGNERPPDPPGLDRTVLENPHYFSDPWNSESFDNVEKHDAVLLIGSSLTMVDIVLTLEARGHAGAIYILSRHGLLSASHLKSPMSRPPFRLSPRFFPPPRTARLLLRLVREEAVLATASGGDWRDAVDALRPITTSLWQSLPVQEQKRFLQRLRSFWDIHRHRAPSQVAEPLRKRIDEGQIQRIAGRLRGIQPSGSLLRATIQRHATGGHQTIDAAFVINCTGPQRDLRRSRYQLLPTLIKKGLVQTDAHSLGLICNEHGAVIDAAGRANKRFLTIGPLRTGQLWESVAVPELRVQAAALASCLLESSDE